MAIALGVCVYLALLARNREQTRRQFAPPIVYLTEPADGDTVPQGASIAISATAIGHMPVTIMELWVDGIKIDARQSDSPAGLSPFFAIFDLLVAEGRHILVVRAVNAKGIIGASPAVSVYGKTGFGEPFQPVLVNPNQTLAEIAQEFATDIPTLQNMNPSLKGKEPLAGTFVKVPPPKPPPGSNPIQLPDSLPLNVSKAGFLETVIGLINPLLVQPPAAPSELAAQVVGCKVILGWNDIANNEQRFEVWMGGPDIKPRAIYKLEPAEAGKVWFEFPAPQPGDLIFWVEAVNPFGRQPSNLVGVSIDSQCPTTAAPQVKIELIEVNSDADYEKAYCYLAIEGAPHRRFPADNASFFQINNGMANIAGWELSKRQFVIPLPTDASIEISGECWGWSSAALIKAGTFSGNYPAETWDGSPRILQSGNLKFVFDIEPFGPMELEGTKTTYSNNDPTLPPPYNLRLKETGTGLGGDVDQWLLWDWNGNSKDIDGYMVYLNGMPYKMIADSSDKGIWSLLPYGCGQHVRWEVAAVAGDRQSALSTPLEYDLPVCALIAVIKFKSIAIGEVDNGVGLLPGMSWNPCDTIGASFGIYVNNFHRLAGRWYADMWTGPADYQLNCGVYTFDQLFRAFPEYQNVSEPDTVRVILKGEQPSITFATRFMYDNSWGEPTNFAMGNKTISMPYEQWKSYKNTFDFYSLSGNVRAFIDIDVWTEMNQ